MATAGWHGGRARYAGRFRVRRTAPFGVRGGLPVAGARATIASGRHDQPAGRVLSLPLRRGARRRRRHVPTIADEAGSAIDRVADDLIEVLLGENAGPGAGSRDGRAARRDRAGERLCRGGRAGRRMTRSSSRAGRTICRPGGRACSRERAGAGRRARRRRHTTGRMSPTMAAASWACSAPRRSAIPAR